MAWREAEIEEGQKKKRKRKRVRFGSALAFTALSPISDPSEAMWFWDRKFIFSVSRVFRVLW